MGMIRKLTSASTLGLVSFRSPRERQAAASQTIARAESRRSRAEAKWYKSQSTPGNCPPPPPPWGR